MGCELKRMLSGRGFLISFFLGLSAILSGTVWPKGNGNLAAGNFLLLAEQSFCCRAVFFLLPLVSVLPWSDSFLAESKGGFLKASLPRQDKRSYTENKVLAVALGGFLPWMAAGLLTIGFYFVLFFPMEQKGTLSFAMVWEPLAVLLRLGILGAILASAGGSVTALFRSAYLAFGLPFAGYYFCLILQERYFPEALWLYPPQWISGSADWGPGKEGLWLFLLLFLAAAAGLHGGILYGRAEEI